nr:hypothetical protein [Tanacetum cinerariifolium]
QFEEGLEGNQRRHAGDLPAGGTVQHPIDFAQLRNPVVRQVQLLDAVEVFLTGAAFDHLQLAGDQRIPHRMFGVGVIDKPDGIRFTGDVLRAHAALLNGLLLSGARRGAYRYR